MPKVRAPKPGETITWKPRWQKLPPKPQAPSAPIAPKAKPVEDAEKQWLREAKEQYAPVSPSPKEKPPELLDIPYDPMSKEYRDVLINRLTMDD